VGVWPNGPQRKKLPPAVAGAPGRPVGGREAKGLAAMWAFGGEQGTPERAAPETESK
jgi:hypothetical protein